jgi:hypothetical protein
VFTEKCDHLNRRGEENNYKICRNIAIAEIRARDSLGDSRGWETVEAKKRSILNGVVGLAQSPQQCIDRQFEAHGAG